MVDIADRTGKITTRADDGKGGLALPVPPVATAAAL